MKEADQFFQLLNTKDASNELFLIVIFKLFFLNDALGGWFHCEIHIFKTEALSTCPVVLLQAVRMYCEENFFLKNVSFLCVRDAPTVEIQSLSS